MNKEKKNPISWVPTTYFAMGLPFVMLSLVSPIIFKDLGVANDQIAFWTSLLILPWSLKPIISVIMEIYGTKNSTSSSLNCFRQLCLGLSFFHYHCLTSS